MRSFRLTAFGMRLSQTRTPVLLGRQDLREPNNSRNAPRADFTRRLIRAAIQPDGAQQIRTLWVNLFKMNDLQATGEDRETMVSPIGNY